MLQPLLKAPQQPLGGTFPPLPPTGPIKVDFPGPFEDSPLDSNESYMAYFPHSGFHNQRIELENALLLASYLNRTLLLPRVFLGDSAMPWLRYPKLYARLLLQTKRGLEHCPSLLGDQPLSPECLNYFRWTSVPWNFFYDMKKISQRVKVIYRDDLSHEWMFNTLHLTAADMHEIKDTSSYEFRVYDMPDSPTPLARFAHRIELASLQAIPHRILQFGSMFGSYRVLAQTKEHAELLLFLRTHMIFRHPVLIDTAAKIVNKIGGVDRFVGLHLRVGDGLFKVRASINIDTIFHELVNSFTNLTLADVTLIDSQHGQDRLENTDYEVRQLRKVQPSEDVYQPIAVQHPADVEDRLGDRQDLDLVCSEANDITRHFRKTVLYIATDCPHPRTHPLLQKIFRVFPCTFILSDFDEDLKDLRRLEVVEEKIRLESSLIPMIDAMISAHGHTFIGTKDSTFTSYIERQLHPAYTEKEIKVMRHGQTWVLNGTN
ncbi:hypothetical protein BDF14DRAFT_1730610 [Spinellus fusiger]|nr:hypothetical protein BDF14DRAFT_1730610 [Spinellus fusiger]